VIDFLEEVKAICKYHGEQYSAKNDRETVTIVFEPETLEDHIDYEILVDQYNNNNEEDKEDGR
jgi:hypothetical protein